MSPIIYTAARRSAALRSTGGDARRTAAITAQEGISSATARLQFRLDTNWGNVTASSQAQVGHWPRASSDGSSLSASFRSKNDQGYPGADIHGRRQPTGDGVIRIMRHPTRERCSASLFGKHKPLPEVANQRCIKDGKTAPPSPHMGYHRPNPRGRRCLRGRSRSRLL
jgi:hypothetical protein